MLKLTRISKSEKVEPGDSDGQAVLYVEDEDVNWEVAELSLRSKFNLTRAKTAQEAFGLLATKTFDLILMDCQMPSMSGLEATRRLLARYPEQGLKIAAVTADATMEGARECQRAGMCAHLSKPFSMNELETLIADVI